LLVSGRSLVPLPPAIITAFIYLRASLVSTCRNVYLAPRGRSLNKAQPADG
jgi:hypothetical protein